MRMSLLFLKMFARLAGVLSPVWGLLAAAISGLGILVAMREGIPWSSGLYFAWVTAMTVGYGDITPTLPGTALLSVVIAIIGVLFTGILVALAVQAVRLAAEEHHGAGSDVSRRLNSGPDRHR